MIEVITRLPPYPNFSNMDVMNEVVYQGHYHPIPDGCPEKIAAILHQCFKKEPKERISLTEITNALI